MAEDRFKVLDGWRGLSIIAVLLCHLFPVGPKAYHFNAMMGQLGMVTFFTLSGFLVTHFLLSRPNVIDFLIRRFFRILPLAWLYICVTLLLFPVNGDVWLAHLFFYGNYPPEPLIHPTSHLWSLCVEMHFYLGIAFIVLLFKRSGLILMPIFCVIVTLLRVYFEAHVSIATHLRVDEILAGSTLALIYDRKLGVHIHDFIAKLNFSIVLVLLLVTCHPDSGFMNYFRPYLAAILVGISLFNPPVTIKRLLSHRVLFYIASISFALYIIHPLLMNSWLGSGDGMIKYMKRPLLLMSLFILAHVSTFYYEKHAISLGKNLAQRYHALSLRMQSKQSNT